LSKQNPTPRVFDPNQLSAQVNRAKSIFASSKGRSDQDLSDNVSILVGSLSDIISQLFQENARKDKIIKDFKVEKPAPKTPPK